jgi:RNA polymerase sigma factor (TIGR02999 family)
MSDRESRNGNISLLLQQLQAGDEAARNELFSVVNGQLKQLARGLMKSERPDHTLQASALVNEACVKLLQQGGIESAENRRQLFAAAIGSMRQILIDHARSRQAAKRGGQLKRQPLDVVLDRFETTHNVKFGDLEEALERLKKESPRQHEVLTMRFFAGLTIEQTAEIMACSTGTVENDWRLARAKLYTWLS